MDAAALIHVVRAASALVPYSKIVIFGSTSVLAIYPTLADELEIFEKTFDTDLIPDPWDERIGKMLDEAIGKESLFFSTYGYHADVVRPDMFENFPPGFETRLIPLQSCPNVFALEPHDMAVAKLIVGRTKDVNLVAELMARGLLDEAMLRKRLRDTPMQEKWLVKSHSALNEAMVQASRQSDPGQ